MADRKQFDPNDQIRAMEASAYAIVALRQRGETISLAEIEQATGLVRYGPRWGTVIGKLKRRCEHERGITLWPVPGGGAYKLCTLEEQLVDVSRARNRRARKQLLKGLRSLEALPGDELSLHHQHVRALKIQHMRKTRTQLHKDGKEESGLLLGKTESGLPPMTR